MSDMMQFDSTFLKLKQSLRFSGTSDERNFALYQAVNYIVQSDLPGAFVECGVYKGGSIIMMCLVLEQLGITNRDIYLYDTFSGMTLPTVEDVDCQNTPAIQMSNIVGGTSCDLLTVQNNIRQSTNYPFERLHFIQGRVEDTLPSQTPSNIALLRLDTDWYESTLHELIHLYPILQSKGVLIIDDYGHWQGCKKAVDQFFQTRSILLGRIDYTGLMGIKL